jgi:hypothetical protein
LDARAAGEREGQDGGGMTPEAQTIKLSSVIFDEVIYPRRDHDPALVQRYADVIDEIEAAQKSIAIAADGKLLDGKHRWLAYRKISNGDDRDIPGATSTCEHFNVSSRSCGKISK